MVVGGGGVSKPLNSSVQGLFGYVLKLKFNALINSNEKCISNHMQD